MNKLVFKDSYYFTLVLSWLRSVKCVLKK